MPQLKFHQYANDRVLEKSTDLHVRTKFIYIKADDPFAYSDVACTQKIDEVDLVDMYLKGAIVTNGSSAYNPVAYTTSAGVGIITCAKPNGTTPTTADLFTAVSSEFVQV